MIETVATHDDVWSVHAVATHEASLSTLLSFRYAPADIILPKVTGKVPFTTMVKGLRNPFSMDIDQTNGDFILGDVGSVSRALFSLGLESRNI